MTDDRLTPEERALIDAVMEWRDMGSSVDLVAAIDTYRAGTTTECLMTRWSAPPNPDGWDAAYPLDHDFGPTSSEVWRVTITPIERVR